MNQTTILMKEYAQQKRNEYITLENSQQAKEAVQLLVKDTKTSLKIFVPDFWDITRYDLDIKSLDRFLLPSERSLEIVSINFKPDERDLADLTLDRKTNLFRLLPKELYSESKYEKRKSELPIFMISDNLAYFYEISSSKPNDEERLINFGNEKAAKTIVYTFEVLKKFSREFHPRMLKRTR